MWVRLLLGCSLAYVLAASVWVIACARVRDHGGTDLLDVSYDPTRQLWRDLNGLFIARYGEETAIPLSIPQSHGGSASQPPAVIDGLEADVVTLALHSDPNAIRRADLIAPGCED